MSSLRRILFSYLFLTFAMASGARSAWAGPTPAVTQNASKPAASGAAPVGAPPAPEEKVAPDSPRAALADFRKLTRAGDFVGAARYLDLSSVDQADGPTLAQHLREVLARHLWLELDKVSASSHGNTEDGLAVNTDQLGSVPGASGQLEPVLLERKSYRPGSHWVFAASTVDRIEGWYDHLGNIWLVEHMPQPLLCMGPRHIRRWQWLGLAPLVVGFFGPFGGL